MPARPSQSSLTVPVIWPYVNVTLWIHAPKEFVPFVYWPAYHATEPPGPESAASLSMPV
ncbi:MAG: hypothetical protein IPJ04_00500 [Candidatus Eisenbacteria bacterium]|nr:hypothetical protein [Candidatus Eisenbacteria bacterium]